VAFLAIGLLVVLHHGCGVKTGVLVGVCCSVLEGKLAEARSKKDTLKARAASAKTSKQVQEMMGSLNTSNAVVAFEKMEEKVRQKPVQRAAAA
jgi:phage shock protein A